MDNDWLRVPVGLGVSEPLWDCEGDEVRLEDEDCDGVLDKVADDDTDGDELELLVPDWLMDGD